MLRGRAGARSGKRQERARLENYGLPTYVGRAYSWLFVFHPRNRDQYEFSIEGHGDALGRPALKLRFEAIPPYDESNDDWVGTIWVDRESYQPLRVEAVAAEEYGQLLALRRTIDSTQAPGEPIERGRFTYTDYETVFDVEENGMRFPGKVSIHRREHIVTGIGGEGTVRRSPIFTVSQTYKRYRFFGVRTAEQIRHLAAAPRD